MIFISQLINGVHVGSIYALVALGYSMVYGIIKLINFAHGDIIMVASYAVWYGAVRMGLPTWAAILLSIVICPLLGMLIEKIAYKPLRGSARISLLITAIGVSFLLQNLARMIFTATPQSLPALIPGKLSVGPWTLSYTTLVTIAVAVVMMLCLNLLVSRTKMGKAMRAVSEDTEAAQLMGINVNHTISFTFAIGSGLAAVAAVLYCCSYPQVSPTMGSLLGLKAFVAAVLGGIGSIPGAMVGGFVIGIAESLTKGYIHSGLADALVFLILIVVLIVRPAGLMGVHRPEKV
jgi:branched-chain amino acid transport system permease protein